ncbi:hypothetical protein B0H11DRAFT_1985593 [Mycena galericulata]|nr:hypothetical protein B0H11DRAFT_1985593 [Mycena galericulata]
MPAKEKPTLPLPDRIQQGILSRADRRTFRVFSLPPVPDDSPGWAHVRHSKSLWGAYFLLGKTNFEALVANLVYKFLPCGSPFFQVICEKLGSEITLCRVLLATGDYEDVPPSPFFGMECASVKEAFLVYFGIFCGSSVHGVFRVRPWTDAVFGLLAEAAVNVTINPKMYIIPPLKPTRQAQVEWLEAPKKKKKSNVGNRFVLADVTNAETNAIPSDISTASTADITSSAAGPSLQNTPAPPSPASSIRPQQKRTWSKKAKGNPVPPPNINPCPKKRRGMLKGLVPAASKIDTSITPPSGSMSSSSSSMPSSSTPLIPPVLL